jgi:hypothetical protein
MEDMEGKADKHTRRRMDKQTYMYIPLLVF